MGQIAPKHSLNVMKDRIRKIMESQHMSQQVFAQFIEMSPASLSSIFNGRTKPTLNIVEAIKKKIPDISTDWLMFGSGPMYLDSSSSSVSDSGSPTPSGPVAKAMDQVLDFSDGTHVSPTGPYAVRENRVFAPNSFNGVKATPSNQSSNKIKIIDNQPRRVIEIRVFYDDQTWDSFVPAKK